jgi:hypothetical protein
LDKLGIEEEIKVEEDYVLDDEIQTLSNDSSNQIFEFCWKYKMFCCLERCAADLDCGENMVCLSEFCECAQQKYKRLPGPRCVTCKIMMMRGFYVCHIISAQLISLETNLTGRVLLFSINKQGEYLF